MDMNVGMLERIRHFYMDMNVGMLERIIVENGSCTNANASVKDQANLEAKNLKRRYKKGLEQKILRNR